MCRIEGVECVLGDVDVLFKTTFLENWGSGAGRIIEACRKQNVEEPEWKAQGGFVIVTFKRPEQKSSTPQVPPKYMPSTSQVRFLIKSMPLGYFSLTAIMEFCGLKDRKSFRTDYIITALDDGAIERKYPGQPNHPRQQYQLTAKAIEWKQQKQ